jgi:hypothetical protein
MKLVGASFTSMIALLHDTHHHHCLLADNSHCMWSLFCPVSGVECDANTSVQC